MHVTLKTLIIVCVCYSRNNVHLPLKQTHETPFWVSHCFLVKKSNCCRLHWLAQQEARCCLWFPFSVVSTKFNPWGVKSASLSPFQFSSMWSSFDNHGYSINLDALGSDKERSSIKAKPPKSPIWGLLRNSDWVRPGPRDWNSWRIGF